MSGARPIRVLEYSHSVAASYCGKLLQEGGFEVIRGPGPLPQKELQLYLNCGKRQVDEVGARLLAEVADVVVTDEPLRFADSPGLVARITPFGCTGPYANYQGTELVVEALGGLLYLVGTPDREPVMPHGYQVSYFG